MPIWCLSALPAPMAGSPRLLVNGRLISRGGPWHIRSSVFSTGEAFQFDWSEDYAVIGGERTKLQVAHIKLAIAEPFWSEPTAANTRCCSTLTGTAFGSLAACLRVEFMTTCAPQSIASAAAKRSGQCPLPGDDEPLRVCARVLYRRPAGRRGRSRRMFGMPDHVYGNRCRTFPICRL